MLVFTHPPRYHTGPQVFCARCEWQRLHYNLVSWARARQEFRV